jgi:ATP phosphoribosyltransferase
MTMLETQPISAAPLTILLPKNRGLIAQIELTLEGRAIPASAQYVRVRGEDVPLLADEFVRSERPVLAFTGDDLVEEWLAAGNILCPRLNRDRIAWNDPAAVYGAPALCLIGWPDQGTRRGKATNRVAACARYRALAQRFIRSLPGEGAAPELVLVSGAVETFVARGVVDYAVDVVLTGKTLAQAGLAVLRVISTSDVAVLEAR